MNRSKSLALAVAAAVPLIAFAIAGCGGSGSASAAPRRVSNATVQVRTTGLGKVLVDAQGRTLYLFKKDSGTKSACFGACAAAWPPLRAAGKPKVGAGAKAAMVATTKRSDGGAQVTYNGHPLYRFMGDKKAGDTNGQGLNAFGGRWFAVSAAGKPVTAAPSNSGGNTVY